MNTSSRVGQCATVSILSLFTYPLNEASCPPVSTVVDSPIRLSEGIYTLMCVYNTNRGIDSVSRVEILSAEHGYSGEKLPNEHDSFS